MALILVKEDGSGKVDSNTYAVVADGDGYHEGHLYATAWTEASTGTKEKSLVMATRLIDAMFAFNGYKRQATQALQWPRIQCRDPDAPLGWKAGLMNGLVAYVNENTIPAAVVQATCELARELIEADRTENPIGEGLRSLRIEGAIRLDFDAKDKQQEVPKLVEAMLEKYGEYLGRGKGTVRLIRA